MFRVISFILRFYPLVMVAVNVVEAVMSSRSGVEKKAVVLNALVSIAGKFGIKVDAPRRRVLEDAIDLIVSVFNLTGFFQHVEPEIEAVQAEVEQAAREVKDDADAAVENRLRDLEEVLSR